MRSSDNQKPERNIDSINLQDLLAHLPCDKITFIDGQMYVNGESLSEEKHPDIYQWVVFG